MSETFSKVEVITGVARRRRFTTEQKLLVVNETLQPGMSISYVARRHGLSPSLVFRWRRLMSEGGKEAVRADEDVVAASEVRRLETPPPAAKPRYTTGRLMKPRPTKPVPSTYLLRTRPADAATNGLIANI